MDKRITDLAGEIAGWVKSEGCRITAHTIHCEFVGGDITEDDVDEALAILEGIDDQIEYRSR